MSNRIPLPLLGELQRSSWGKPAREQDVVELGGRVAYYLATENLWKSRFR